MKKIDSYYLPIFALFILFSSCQQEENPSPANVKTGGLTIDLQYPATVTYDSAYILFRNDTREIKLKLTLNNSSHVATGRVFNLPFGEWTISTSYFNTLAKSRKSFETNGTADLLITATATHLISNESGVYIEDENDLTKKVFEWTDYYYYHLYADARTDKPDGFVRLPKDPTNPFVQISTFDSKWNYAYADRTFYNSSPDGSSNFYQGGGAFEIYDERVNIIDTTSLEPAISGVVSKIWNNVDCIIVVYGDNENDELLLYHRWDLRLSEGRVWSKTKFSNVEIEKRKLNNLNAKN